MYRAKINATNVWKNITINAPKTNIKALFLLSLMLIFAAVKFINPGGRIPIEETKIPRNNGIIVFKICKL